MITEKELSYAGMEQAVLNGELCAKCQGALTIAWGGSLGENGYVLRCGNDINHTGITRHDKKQEQKLKEGFSMDSTALTTMTETQMMERVNMARFPQDLTIADKKLLAQVAITYGFDPLMGEVSIYQGRPFVSIDGRYRKAQETGQLDGVETRPANEQERKDWQIPEGDFFYRSEVWVKGSSRPFVAWGRVYRAETIGGKGYKPVEKNPQRMAEKRAEAQALRKAFHIPLPSVEDIGSPDYDVDSTARVVDTSTGEIIEGNAKKNKPTPEKIEEVQSKAEGDIHDLWPEPEEEPRMSQAEIKQAKGEPQPATITPEKHATEGIKDESSVVDGQQDVKPAQTEVFIDMDWLKESLNQLSWTDVLKYIKEHYKITAKKVSEAVNQMTKEQQQDFVKTVRERLELK